MARKQTRETHEERLAREANEKAARRVKKVDEFKAEFLRDTGRRVLAGDAWYKQSELPPAVRVLARKVYEYTETGDRLQRALENAQAEIAQGLERLAKDDLPDPVWHSGSMAARMSDVDEYRAKRKTLADFIVNMAWATGYRVPQVEGTAERQKQDRMSAHSVVSLEGLGWAVQRRDEDGKVWHLLTDVSPASEGTPTGELAWTDDLALAMVYPTELNAWFAMHLVVTGTPVRGY